MDKDNIIYLSDDDGTRAAFEFLDLIEYEGCEYVVLLPEHTEEEGTVVILQLEDLNEEEDAYLPVEDEDTLEAVFEIFKARLEEAEEE